MAYGGVIYAKTLGELNLAAAGAINILNPLLAQIDFSLFGSLGIGSLQADLQAQLQAAIQAKINIGINLANPFVGFQLALVAIAQLQAQIAAALNGAVPAISIEATTQISAILALEASLAARIGGLEALIQGALAVKIPATNFAGQLAAHLAAGPIFLLSFEDVPLSTAGTSLSADFTAGLVDGPNSIGPGELASGIVLVTKSPSAWLSLKAILATGT